MRAIQAVVVGFIVTFVLVGCSPSEELRHPETHRPLPEPMGVHVITARSGPLRGYRLLVAAPPRPNASYPGTAAGQLPLTASSAGVISVGSDILVAPNKTDFAPDGTDIIMPGIGSFRLGDSLPLLAGVSTTYSAADLPPDLAPFGRGPYQFIFPQR
ncbi:MAG TPA: hypothetical protein VGC45_05800 [Gryllotalpicola sp.]